MKVSRHVTASSPIIDIKTLENDDRVSRKLNDPSIVPTYLFNMPAFFEPKNYGKGVREIFYQVVCLIEDHKVSIPLLYAYTKKNKLIECIVELDYEKVLKMEIPELRKYMSEKYMERSKDFLKLEIPDFDCEKYLEDFKSFFVDNNMS